MGGVPRRPAGGAVHRMKPHSRSEAKSGAAPTHRQSASCRSLSSVIDLDSLTCVGARGLVSTAARPGAGVGGRRRKTRPPVATAASTAIVAPYTREVRCRPKCVMATLAATIGTLNDKYEAMK